MIAVSGGLADTVRDFDPAALVGLLQHWPWLETARTLRERFREDRLGLALDDLVDPGRLHADVPGQAILGNPQWLEELLQQDPAGMERFDLLGHGVTSCSAPALDIEPSLRARVVRAVLDVAKNRYRRAAVYPAHVV